MTQHIVTTTQPGDIVVIVPGWAIRTVGFLSLFVGMSGSFFLVFAGYLLEGLLLAALMLVIVPLGLLIQYAIWRFYWYLLIAVLMLQSACYGLALIGASSWMGQLPASVSGTPLASTAAALTSANPTGGLIALMIGALITAVLWRLYTLWRLPRRQPENAAPPDGEEGFDFVAPYSLTDRVMQKLNMTGAKGEVKGDTIHVYKRGQFVGIVRVVDRAAAISPLIVQDVAKQRDRLGVKIAYLATSGTFKPDSRSLAESLNVSLMSV